jgi:hypothetical protein
VCACVYADDTTYWIDWPSIGRFAVQLEPNRIRAWPAPALDASRLHDQFTRRIQHLILQARGYQALHASGVQIQSTAIAFAGASGSGKSTLARALEAGDCRQIADDALLLDLDGGRPEVLPLSFSPQLRGPAKELSTTTRGHDSGVVPRLPLGAVLILEQNDAATIPQLDRLRGPAACVELMKHAHVFDPAAGRDRFVTSYAAIADRVPVLHLTYRPVFQELHPLTRFVREAIDALLLA